MFFQRHCIWLNSRDRNWCVHHNCPFLLRPISIVADILSLLPTEISLYILRLLCTGDPPCSDRLSIAASGTSPSLSEAYHSIHAIHACLAVSRTWRHLAEDNTVWRALFLSRWSVDFTRHRATLHRHPPMTLGHRVGGMVEYLPVRPASPQISPLKGFRMKIGKRRIKHLLPGVGVEIPSTPSSRHTHNLPPSLSSPSTPTDYGSPLPSPVPLESRLLSPFHSPSFPSCPRHWTTTLNRAPLQANWYALYRERLELEKRWNGITRPVALSNFPESEWRRRTSITTSGLSSPMISPSSSTTSNQSTDAQGEGQTHASTPSSHVPFAPQVLSIAGHTDSVYCLELDSRRIITGSRDRTIKVWSLKGKLLGSFGCGNAGHGDTATSRMEVQGHTGSVLCLKFSADWDQHGDVENGEGEEKRGFMVSGSSDCTVCVWDLYVGGRRKSEHHLGDENGYIDDEREVYAEVRAVLRGHAGGVLDLRIDDNWIVSW